ncbi:FprA family A-type flavoprotein [Vallitalea okinawensis]|uniref:FprA family A-type flavoprotein n=1 Tax=Vallitalea okinawensis TaxID=2078660 RepID=UPI000CFC87FD|nr:FprA family A-type flavoprotein [Vallitalea okinawensis]
MKALEVKKGTYWVGAQDPDLRVFDIIMYTEYGTSYNSYIVKGSDKTALFETAKNKFKDDWFARIEDVTSYEDIDYIILDHTEPDHAGSLEFIVDKCPNATVIGSTSAVNYLKDITNKPFKFQAVKDGDEISLGDKTIRFYLVPFLHWPDSMYSYVVEDKTLITCDSFGCHYSDDRVFNDLIEGDFLDAYKYYFDMIMGPFKPYVLKALNKIKDLEVDTVCPGHGPVLREDIKKYMDLYREWATTIEREKGSIVIAYVSAYGYTEKLAKRIAEGIESVSDYDVLTYDMVTSDQDDVLKEINMAKGLLLGSPTIVADALPPIWGILTSLNPVINKGLISGAFGSYGWSGEAVPNIEGRLKQLKFKIPVEGLRIKFNPSKSDLEKAFEFGVQFGNEVK